MSRMLVCMSKYRQVECSIAINFYLGFELIEYLILDKELTFLSHKKESSRMQNLAKSNLQHDNERTRVTLWTFTPNAATG